MKVLVTGGNGRLGRWVGPALMADGHDVVSVDRHLPDVAAAGVHYREVEMRDLGPPNLPAALRANRRGAPVSGQGTICALQGNR